MTDAELVAAVQTVLDTIKDKQVRDTVNAELQTAYGNWWSYPVFLRKAFHQTIINEVFPPEK